ncbi:hypothetical protein BDZ89DRAFT_1156035 [Hymenopellis radicata]|nr:hypothetical protein BDZ89DRAFT_1156035 [Hymenopellis radicata]
MPKSMSVKVRKTKSAGPKATDVSESSVAPKTSAPPPIDYANTPGFITWHYDPTLDTLDKYGDYTICIRPPYHALPTFYFVRVFDKDMNLVNDPTHPIWMYDAAHPNRRNVSRIPQGSMWTALSYRKYMLKDGDKVICEFGGEWIIRPIPYRSITRGDKL